MSAATPKVSEQGAPPGAHRKSHAEGGLDEMLLSDLAPAEGPVPFAQQQATGLCIENRIDDPDEPAVGQIWLRTDL